MKTVCVIEGFSGGPLHTRGFRKSLEEAGFKVIKNRHNADVVVAHSAGIYGIPTDTEATLLMLIGPTYWPGNPLLKRVARHTKSSKKFLLSNFGRRHYLWTRILQSYYFFRRNIYMWYGIFHNNRLGHLNRLIQKGNRKVLIIRNLEDPFISPDIAHKISGRNVKYIELPGVHEDFVSNPKPYIDLLLKEI